MPQDICLQLKLPLNTVSAPLVSEIGLTMIKLKLRELRVVKDFTTSPMSENVSEDLIINKQVPQSHILVSPLNTKNKIFKGKLNISKKNTNMKKSSQILVQDSITIEKVSKNCYPKWNLEMSKKLWLPTKIDCVDMELNSLKESSERIIRHSWFSVTKLVAKNQNLEQIYSTSATSSSLKEMKENQLNLEMKENQCLQKPLLSVRIHLYRLNIDKELQKIYKNTFDVCRKVYNLCVDWHRQNPQEIPKLKILRSLFINSDSIYNDIFKEVPYEMKDGAIRDFITALKTSKILVKSKKVKFFEMKYRIKKKNQSLNIPHKFINYQKDKITNKLICYAFPTFFGKKSLNSKKIIKKPKHDCRLLWKDDYYYLAVPVEKKIKEKKKKNIQCSIDPGERNFNTLYGTDKEAFLVGKSFKIDKLSLTASNLRNGIDKYGNKINKRKKRKNVIKIAGNMERKAKNLIKDIHHKLCKFITSKYSNVIIPEFKTQEMVKKKEGKIRKIGNGTARRLLRWSHYKFRQLLIAKGEINNCKINVESEEWTSKTCGNCFNVKENLGGAKQYKCLNCKVKIDRDLNGARNIMILNYKKMDI